MKNYIDSFPSLILPEYKERVLARLLPSEEAVAQMDRLTLLSMLREKAKLQKLVDADPVRFFQPNEGGQREFMTCDDSAVTALYFFAGNQTGKTTGAAIRAAEMATGKALWGREWRTVNYRTPSTGFIYCEDFATHEQTIIPTFLSWCPRRLLDPTNPLERGPTGSVNKIHMRDGTVIYLRTYDQGYLKAEGKAYDWGWCDEPPPRDIFTAIWRGLVARNGVLLIAATLLNNVWLYDEQGKEHVRVFSAAMPDNKWLAPAAVKNYIESLTEDEKQIRIYGKPHSLTGVIYPDFIDGPPFVIPQVEIPWDVSRQSPWPIILGIDPHERKPLYCEWAYLTPDNRIIWFDWALVPSGDLTRIFEFLKEREATHVAPAALIIMDPNRGKAIQMGGSSWAEAFEEKGYDVQLGIDNINFGHAQMREMLAVVRDADGEVVAPPQMQWMAACGGDRKGSPVYQMVRYTWQDWARGSRMEKDIKEKPHEKNKDFPDIHRYVAAAKLNYKLLNGTDLGMIRFGGRSQENPYVKGAGIASRAFDPAADAADLLERFGGSDRPAPISGRNSHADRPTSGIRYVRSRW